MQATRRVDLAVSYMESKAQEPAVAGSRAAITDASTKGAPVATAFHAESMISASRLVNARLIASFARTGSGAEARCKVSMLMSYSGFIPSSSY